jgi:hypothetical protein
MRAIHDVDRVDLQPPRVGGKSRQTSLGQAPAARTIEVLAFEEQRRHGA